MSILSSISSFASGISLKIIAGLVAAILALGTWFYVDEMADKATHQEVLSINSRLKSDLAEVEADLKISQKDLKDTISANKTNLKSIHDLQAELLANEKICTDQVTGLKKDLAFLKDSKRQVREYAEKNPLSILNVKIPDEVIDLVNGKGKKK